MATIGYGYGSEWHLLQHLGRRRSAFTTGIEALIDGSEIQWLDHEEYVEPSTGSLIVREPRGLEFLPSTDAVRQEWEDLWPQSGNVHNWDAVGRGTAATQSAWVLVEAKANLGELVSSCGAKSEASRRRIKEILGQTRSDLGVANSADWTREHYQYCNRIALLHFLRTRGVYAHLVFVYFTSDRHDIGTGGRQCPISEAGWDEALGAQDAYVGLPPTAPIRRSIHRLFLPAYRASIAEQVLKPEYRRTPASSMLSAIPVASVAAPSSELARAFDGAMMQIYAQAKKEAGYTATRFHQMLAAHGGTEAARRLLPQTSDGFTQLWSRGRLDLTVESLIVQPRWQGLFSDEERDVARRRLIECGAKL